MSYVSTHLRSITLSLSFSYVVAAASVPTVADWNAEAEREGNAASVSRLWFRSRLYEYSMDREYRLQSLKRVMIGTEGWSLQQCERSFHVS